jgi:hypothetical protein
LFGTYTKIAENHNVVATIGNTIFKTFGNGLFATGFDVPYNSWELQILARGISETVPTGSYNYDDRRFLLRKEVNMIIGKYLFS